jgi:hypothetical protein
MAAELAAGSQTAVINTEHTLDTRSAVGTYQCHINTSNMLNGDVLEVRVYVKARAADGSALLQQFGTYSNKQTTVIVSPMPVLASYCYFTIKQTAGTGRAYTWSVLG